jgi:hypothetical protein
MWSKEIIRGCHSKKNIQHNGQQNKETHEHKNDLHTPLQDQETHTYENPWVHGYWVLDAYYSMIFVISLNGGGK